MEFSNSPKPVPEHWEKRILKPHFRKRVPVKNPKIPSPWDKIYPAFSMVN